MNKKLNSMLKEAQKMQKKMMEMQDDLQNQKFEGSSGGGVVKVVFNGAKVMESIKFDPDIIDPEDVEMLEDLVLSAVNDALEQIEKKSNDQFSSITGNLNIPGLSL